MLLPVEGNKGLFRDKDSSAILNCSDSDHQRYLELKNRKIQDINKMNEMTEKINEIEQLKSDVNEMKDMMKLILLKLDSTS